MDIFARKSEHTCGALGSTFHDLGWRMCSLSATYIQSTASPPFQME